MHASNEKEHTGIEQQHLSNGCPAQERFHHRLIHSVPNVILFLSVDHLILEFNPEAERLYGRKREDVLGKNYFEEFLPKDARQAVAADIEKVLAGKPTRDFENTVIAHDGHEHILRWSVDRVLDSNNNPIGIVAIGQDITEREQVGEELKESEAKYIDLYENAPDMYASVNAKTALIEECNITLANTLGYSKKEIIGRPVFEIYHPDCLNEVKNAFQLFIETGEVRDKELQLRRKDGSKLDISLNVSAVRGNDGSILYSRSTLRDITERKRAEEAYRSSVNRFEDLFNKAAIPLCFVNKELTTLNFNTKFEKTFGYSQQEVPTLNEWWQLAYPDPNYRKWVIDTCGAALQRAIEAKTDIEPIEYQVTCKNGDIRTMVVFGGFIGQDILLTFFDITERKQMERERLAHLRFLENVNSINQAVQLNNDLEQMMSDVLDVVLSIFDCDRAYLMYPCDPESPTYTIPMECTKPEYPGGMVLNLELPMDPRTAEIQRVLLAVDSPEVFDLHTPHPLPEELSKRFDLKTLMAMAVYPKIGSPWHFGIMQCSYAREWTDEERRLFKEIGRRLEDALTSLLMNRNLKDSEKRYRMVFENSPVSIWEEDFSGIKTLFNKLRKEGIDDIETYFARHPETVRQCAEMTKIIDVNRAALALHGAANKEELLASIVNTFTPESFDTYRQELVCLWNGETEMSADAVVKTLTGERRSVTVCFSVCPGHEQTLSKVLVSLIDITERKRNQAINDARLHLMQFAATHSVEELLEETLNEAEKLTGSLIGFYHFVEEDQKSLTLQNWSKRTKAEFCKAKGKGLHYPIADAGVWVDCVYKRKPVIHNDYASLPHRKGMPEGHAEVIRELVVPVLRGDMIKAILGVGNKPDDYTEKDVEAVSLLADLAWEIVERKQAEEALLESERRYRIVADNTYDWEFWIDPDGQFLYTSPSCRRITGHTADEFACEPDLLNRIIHPEDKERFKAHIKYVTKKKEPDEIEFRILLADGSMRHIGHACQPVFNNQGRYLGIRGSNRDITKAKRAELDLKESEERYRAIVAGFDGLIYICSQDYRVEFMNDRFIKRTGYNPIGQLCYKALHDLDSICSWCVNDRVFKGETVRWEVKSPKDDRWYYVVNTPIYHADGSVSKQAMILDITERKKVEEELDKHREHLEELVRERTEELEVARNKARQYLDIAGVVLVAIDANRRVTLINQKGCEILGKTTEDIIGKDWFETFIPANIRQDVIQGFDRLMSGEIETVEYFENPVLTQGGEERLIAWHNALLRDDEDNIVGTLSSGEDITEQRRAEEQITSLNQDLLNRTTALEAANEDLEAFAYSVSHDLRAPLRHIEGFTELLRRRMAAGLDERSLHYMDTISDSVKHMGILIDDLLSFSRMGRHQITKQHVNLGKLTQEIIRDFKSEIVKRDIHWHVDDLPAVIGDHTMLRMVLVNLISNALKFTRPRERAEIEIGWLREKETKTVIFVRDNGVGFDMNYADKLFNVFQRLHQVDEFEGTGIGLANVRRIINRHGGRTWAEGKTDHGATFYFSLPTLRKGT